MIHVSGERRTNNFHSDRPSVGIRYGSGPVEPLPIRFAHKDVCACVTTANP
jgi:hypothetical protein